MYVYDESVNSILKAGFLYAHTGQYPIYQEEENLLFANELHHVNYVKWDYIYNLNPKFQSKKEEITNSQVLNLFFYNLRHTNPYKHQII